MKCWLCGDDATTGEHKIKQTVIKKLMFENSKINSSVKIFAQDSKDHKILQSSKSDHIKYKKNLCSYCNNTFTQPFDLSYDIFFNYLIENEKKISLENRISLKKIQSEYHNEFNQQNLFKYFVKSFCCMIDSTKDSNNPLIVPESLINAIKGKEYDKELLIQFVSNRQPKDYPLNKIIQVTNPDLYLYEDGTFSFIYCESYGWFHIFYMYQNFCLSRKDTKILKKKVGNYWVGKNPKIKIKI